MINAHSIAIDCERMKYPNTGLFHYCYHLGKALSAIEKKEQLCFYVPKKLSGIFGKDQCYIEQASTHKILFPSLKNVAVWHSTHQSTDYFPAKKKMKIVLTIHDLNFLYDEQKTEKKKAKYKQALQQKIGRADHIVAISEFTLQDVQRNFDIVRKPSSVIYNGCNIEEIRSLTTPELVPPKAFLFTIGTIVEKKNFHVLPALLKNNDRYLIIAGITQNEAYKQTITGVAKRLGVEDRVLFTGAVSENDKQWYYKHCEAFVFPSIAEGFGLPAVEAMYFGKPVLLSDYTSLPEIGGDAAYYFKNFEAEAMQQALAESLNHFKQNNRAEEVKKRAAFFNWTESAKQYLAVYRSLM